jgi:cephalosporin hydroxylase
MSSSQAALISATSLYLSLTLNYSQMGAASLKKEQDMLVMQWYLWIQSWNLGL